MPVTGSWVAWNQRQRLFFPFPQIFGSPPGSAACKTDPDCGCGGSLVIGDVTKSLKTEYMRWFLPPGARLGDLYCVNNQVCCAPSSNLPCCPGTTLPAMLNIAIDGGAGACACMTGNYTLLWNAQTKSWRYSGSICGHAFELDLTCGVGGFLLMGFCGLSWSSTNEEIHLVSCEPLKITGGVGGLGGPNQGYCCGTGDTGFQFSFTITAGGVGGSPGGSLFLALQYQRVFLPWMIAQSNPVCLMGSDCCLERITPNCCPIITVPQTLYLLFQNVRYVTQAPSCEGCPDLEGMIFPITYGGGVPLNTGLNCPDLSTDDSWAGGTSLCHINSANIGACFACKKSGVGNKFSLQVGLGNAIPVQLNELCREHWASGDLTCPPQPVYYEFLDSQFTFNSNTNDACCGYGPDSGNPANQNGVKADIFLFE